MEEIINFLTSEPNIDAFEQWSYDLWPFYHFPRYYFDLFLLFLASLFYLWMFYVWTKIIIKWSKKKISKVKKTYYKFINSWKNSF